MPNLLQPLARVLRLTPFGDRRELGLDGLIADGRVAIGLTLPEALQERIRRPLALRGGGEEQEMLRMLMFGAGLLEGALQDRSDIADAYTPGGSGSREHDLADEFGAGLRDHLRDEAAQREAEKVDLRETKSLDERDRILRHVGDVNRGLAARAAHAAIVEDDDAAAGGDAVEDLRVPVVEHGREVVQEDHRHSAALSEFAIRKLGVLHLDGPRGGVLKCLIHRHCLSLGGGSRSPSDRRPT